MASLFQSFTEPTKAVFERCTVEIQVALIQIDGKWKIKAFNVKPEQPIKSEPALSKHRPGWLYSFPCETEQSTGGA